MKLDKESKEYYIEQAGGLVSVRADVPLTKDGINDLRKVIAKKINGIEAAPGKEQRAQRQALSAVFVDACEFVMLNLEDKTSNSESGSCGQSGYRLLSPDSNSTLGETRDSAVNRPIGSTNPPTLSKGYQEGGDDFTTSFQASNLIPDTN